MGSAPCRMWSPGVYDKGRDMAKHGAWATSDSGGLLHRHIRQDRFGAAIAWRQTGPGGCVVHIRENGFERATELFYEAAAVPELWPKALQAVAEAAGAAAVTLLPIRAGSNSIIGSPSIRGFLDDFMAGGWLHINPYMRRGLELTTSGWRGLITSEDMLTPEQKAADPYVNEVEAPAGSGPKAGIFLVSRRPDLALPMTIERHLGSGPFLRSEIGKLNHLMSRLDAGAKLALKVGFESSVRLADGLATTGAEIVLLNGAGRVIHSPPSFERHLGDGLTLRRGLLRSWHRPTDAKLNAAIQQAVTYAPAGERAALVLPLPRRHGRCPLIAQVVPIAGAGQDVFMLARAALILTDPDTANPVDALDEALKIIGLTAAEARLAKRIGAGEELKAIAEVEGIALETARARPKAVFAKTGTHRQVELAILIAGMTR